MRQKNITLGRFHQIADYERTCLDASMILVFVQYSQEELCIYAVRNCAWSCCISEIHLTERKSEALRRWSILFKNQSKVIISSISSQPCSSYFHLRYVNATFH